MQTNERIRQLSLAASQCMREGRIDDGIEAYQSLLALKADIPDAWYNLAYLHRCTRHFNEAVESYRRALAAGIPRPEEVHVNLAVILSEHLNRPEAAEDELKAALNANPHFLPAWLNLGNLYEDLGEPLKARSAYEKAIEAEPRNGRALGRIAMIDVFEGQANASIPRLRQALESASVPPEDAAEIQFALGHALDSVGAIDEAFAALSSANASALEGTPPHARYNAEAQEHLIDELIKTFSTGADSVDAPASDIPIFICGMFRSGSTLAEQILAAHSRVTAGGELEFLPALVVEKLQPYPQTLSSPSPARLADLRDSYMRDLSALHPEYDVITDKRPDNFLHIGLIKTLFPTARIVHTFRNPADNILSLYFGNFDQSISYSNKISDMIHWYKQYLRLMDHWKKLYGKDIHDLDYDAVVEDPESAIRNLLQFCRLDWEEACLVRKPAKGAIRTLSAWQVRQPLHGRSSGRWKSYRAHMREVDEWLGTI